MTPWTKLWAIMKKLKKNLEQKKNCQVGLPYRSPSRDGPIGAIEIFLKIAGCARENINF